MIMNLNVKGFPERAIEWTGDLGKSFLKHLPNVSAETLGWLAPIVIHCATIPTFLALMTGLSDRTPGLDLIFFVWSGLVLLFARAIVLKDMLNVTTIGTGFIVQAVMMSMILFKQ
jgi:hypothetical protein